MAKRTLLSLPCAQARRVPRNSPPAYLLVTRPCLLVFGIVWACLYFLLSSLLAILPIPSKIKLDFDFGDTSEHRTRPRPVRKRSERAPLTVVTALSTSLPAATLSPELTTRSLFTRRAQASPAGRTTKRGLRIAQTFERHSLDDVLESEEEDDAMYSRAVHDHNSKTSSSRQSSEGEYLSDMGSPGYLTPDIGTDESEHSEAETLVDGEDVPTHNSGKGVKHFSKVCPRLEARRAQRAARARSDLPGVPTSPMGSSAGPSSSRLRRSASCNVKRGSSPKPQRPPIVTVYSAPSITSSLTSPRSDPKRPSFSRSSSDSSTLVASPAGSAPISSSNCSEKRHSSWLAILRPFRMRSPLVRSPVSSPSLLAVKTAVDSRDVGELDTDGEMALPASAPSAPAEDPSLRPALDSSGNTRLDMEHLSL